MGRTAHGRRPGPTDAPDPPAGREGRGVEGTGARRLDAGVAGQAVEVTSGMFSGDGTPPSRSAVIASVVMGPWT